MENLNETWIVILIIAVILFFALRVVNLWYWKIDKGIDLLTEQNRLLKKLVGEDESSPTKKNEWECPKCKHKNSNATFTCENCNYKLQN